jgi:hypothetical protein
MDNTLLWEAFTSLSSKEIREMERLVISPFFNRKDQLQGLFGYLRACRDAKQNPKSDAAFRAAYPGLKSYSDQKLRLANSNLLHLIETYWQLTIPEESKLKLAATYRRRNLTKPSAICLREARQQLNASPYRDASYFDQLVAIESEDFHQASALKRYEAFNLQEISDLLDASYLTKKLRHVCLSLSHQAVFNAAYDFGLYQQLVEVVAGSEKLMKIPAIALYYHACRFLADPNEEAAFWDFRELLSQSSGLFPPEDLRSLYLLAINFGVKKSNESAETAWYATTFGLYQAALERGLLLENGLLSRFAYNNIVGFAMRLDEMDWAEQFIENYKSSLDRRYREAAFSMNRARIAYAKQAYGDALLYLQKADYDDFINSMNARILQMKIYFETDEEALLESHLDSMERYIRRKRAAGYHRENYLNIVRFTRSVLRCAFSNQQEIDKLKEEIINAPVLTERNWLLEKLQ